MRARYGHWVAGRPSRTACRNGGRSRLQWDRSYLKAWRPRCCRGGHRGCLNHDGAKRIASPCALEHRASIPARVDFQIATAGETGSHDLACVPGAGLGVRGSTARTPRVSGEVGLAFEVHRRILRDLRQPVCVYDRDFRPTDADHVAVFSSLSWRLTFGRVAPRYFPSLGKSSAVEVHHRPQCARAGARA
jgi:hypothetical protein